MTGESYESQTGTVAVWQAIGDMQRFTGDLQRAIGRLEGRMDGLEARMESLEKGMRLLSQSIDRLTIAFVGSIAVLSAATIGGLTALAVAVG